MFKGASRSRVLADHKYVIDHPLIRWRDVRFEDLVGREITAYVSTSGKISGGPLGGKRTRPRRKSRTRNKTRVEF